MILLNGDYLTIAPDDLIPDSYKDMKGYDKDVKYPAIFISRKTENGQEDVNAKEKAEKIYNYFQDNAIASLKQEHADGWFVVILRLPTPIKIKK